MGSKMTPSNDVCPLCSAQDRSYEVVRIGKATILGCRNCTNAWTDPSPTFIKYDEEDFYGHGRYQSMADLPRQWRNGYIRQIKTIKSSVKPGSVVLEIGCGQGLLMTALNKEGYHVVGIEPSISGSEKAIEKGLTVINDYFPSKRLEGQKYDLVVLSQVLEHIKDFNQFIDRVLVTLTKVGKVLFVQTNWKGLMPRYLKSGWYAWVPDQHYWHFTPKGLAIILEQKGCRVEKVEWYSLEHSDHILSRLTEVFPKLSDQFHMLVNAPV